MTGLDHWWSTLGEQDKERLARGDIGGGRVKRKLVCTLGVECEHEVGRNGLAMIYVEEE